MKTLKYIMIIFFVTSCNEIKFNYHFLKLKHEDKVYIKDRILSTDSTDVGYLSHSEIRKLVNIDSIILENSSEYLYNFITHLKNVKFLQIFDSSIAEINISDNESLNRFDLINLIPLEKLVLQDNKLLSYIVVMNNQNLKEVIITDNSSLRAMSIVDNKLEKIVLNDNNTLFSLNLTNDSIVDIVNLELDNLTELDLSNNYLKGFNYNLEKLEYLSLYNNLLRNIDINKSTNLKYLYVGNNSIGNLNLKSNLELEVLDCVNNKLLKLDLRENMKLRKVYATGNQIDTILISKSFDGYIEKDPHTIIAH